MWRRIVGGMRRLGGGGVGVFRLGKGRGEVGVCDWYVPFFFW